MGDFSSCLGFHFRGRVPKTASQTANYREAVARVGDGCMSHSKDVRIEMLQLRSRAYPHEVASKSMEQVQRVISEADF